MRVKNGGRNRVRRFDDREEERMKKYREEKTGQEVGNFMLSRRSRSPTGSRSRRPAVAAAGSDPAGRAAGGAALRKGGEAVQQAIGEISQKAAFRLKKRRPVGRRSFFAVWSDMGRFCGG